MLVRRRTLLGTGLAALAATPRDAQDARERRERVQRQGGSGPEERDGRTFDLGAYLDVQLDATRAAVWAVDLRSGRRLDHDGHHQRPLLTLSAGLAAAQLLRTATPLTRRVRYGADDVVPGSPVAGGHVREGMSVAQLCTAALGRGDDTAANLLLQLSGGPLGLTRFCRSLGDGTTRVDRWSPESASGEPWDPRDTTTARALARDYGVVLLGPALPAASRLQLRSWLPTALLAGGWSFSHVTATGWYGTAGAVGIARRGTRQVVLASLVRGADATAPGTPQAAMSPVTAVLQALDRSW